MCVTNTTSRRPVTLSAAQLGQPKSAMSQLICNSLFLGTLSKNIPAPTPSATTSTWLCKPSFPVTEPIIKKNRKHKPQKPGKTAKNHDRHFVTHDYHDHSRDVDQEVVKASRRQGGISIAFPTKLHALLKRIENDGLADVVSWQPHGRCFVVRKPKEFVERILPEYFKQTKLTSFQRQLNLYGFQRVTKGVDAGGYYHELFLRGKEFLCKGMIRTKVKGTGFKGASSPDSEPDFWRLPPVNAVTPHHSEDDASSTQSEDSGSSDEPSQPAVSVPSFVTSRYPAAVVEPPVEKAVAFNRPFVPVPSAHIPISFRIPSSPVKELSIPPATVKTEPSPVRQVSSEMEVADDVFDELFPEGEGENDVIFEFVNEWACDLEDDAQLGRLLERMVSE